MTGDPSEPEQGDISSAFIGTIQLFRAVLARLPHYQDVCEPNILTATLDEYGRLRIWGEETRALLPSSSRGSLDDVLRKESKLRTTGIRILERLRRKLHMIVSIIEKNPERLQSGPHSADDTDESDDSDDSSSEDEGRLPSPATVLRRIAEDITSLYQLSQLVKRPGFSRRYIHSTGQYTHDRRVAHYASFDMRHLEEKLLQFNQSQRKVTDDEELAADVGEEASDPVMSGIVCKHFLAARLASANTRRREQLDYWSRHPDVVPSVPDYEAVAEDMLNTNLDQETSALPERSRPDLILDETKTTVTKSDLSKQTFSQVARTDLLEAQTISGPARTVYAETTWGNKNSNRVPTLPQAAQLDSSFECPFCHLEIKTSSVERRQDWKRHVFRDLRPYVCTFESCNDPDKQYLTRHDWAFHERQAHRRKWICQAHEGQSFFSLADFRQHVEEFHGETQGARQRDILYEISERPIEDSDLEILPCPLCPAQYRLHKLEGHIAEHLESIALFVLPALSDADEDGSNSRSALGIGRLSEHAMSEAASSLPSESEGSRFIVHGRSALDVQVALGHAELPTRSANDQTTDDEIPSHAERREIGNEPQHTLGSLKGRAIEVSGNVLSDEGLVIAKLVRGSARKLYARYAKCDGLGRIIVKDGVEDDARVELVRPYEHVDQMANPIRTEQVFALADLEGFPFDKDGNVLNDDGVIMGRLVGKLEKLGFMLDARATCGSDGTVWAEGKHIPDVSVEVINRQRHIRSETANASILTDSEDATSHASVSTWGDWQWSEQYRRYYRQRYDATTGEWKSQWAEVSVALPTKETGATQPVLSASDNYAGAYNEYGRHHDEQSRDKHLPLSSPSYSDTHNVNYGETGDVTTGQSSGASLSNHLAATSQYDTGPHTQQISDESAEAAEKLDSSFRRVENRYIRKFFKAGRVFALLWTEPSHDDSRNEEMDDAFSVVRFGQSAYTEIRRFIVVRSFVYHSICIPITSYRRRGTTEREDAAHHSIAFSADRSPETLLGERLDRHPIAIKMEEGQTLDIASRINFGKLYTIEHNVKVKAIGKIQPEYLQWVLEYCRQSTGIELTAQ